MMYIRVSINNKYKKQGGCYKEKGIPIKSFIELSKILDEKGGGGGGNWFFFFV